MIPIVDTHQHLWDLSLFHLPWLSGGGKLAEDHTMKRYVAEAVGLNIGASIYMEVDVDPSQHSAEADYVIDLCASDDNPMAAATIGGRPSSPGFAEYVEKYACSPYVKGVRQVLHNGMPTSEFLSGAFVDGVRIAGQHGLHFDLCLQPEDIAAGAELADRCQNTQFVLDHCGNGNPQSADLSGWKSAITDMARRENVICKISGIVVFARPEIWTPADLEPIITHCAEAFGPDRIIFGSDWPVCTLKSTYSRWVTALLSIISGWSETERRKLLNQNAIRFYRLPQNLL